MSKCFAEATIMAMDKLWFPENYPMQEQDFLKKNIC